MSKKMNLASSGSKFSIIKLWFDLIKLGPFSQAHLQTHTTKQRKWNFIQARLTFHPAVDGLLALSEK